MTRYQKAKQELDKMRPEDMRFCESKGACACKGCLNQKGITQQMLKLYKEGKL